MKIKKYSNSHIIRFIIFFVVVALIVGFLLFYKNIGIFDNIVVELDNYNSTIINTKQNFIIPHLLVISLLLLCSFTIIGVVFILFYLFYEFVSIGYLFAVFVKWKGIKGLLFSSSIVITSKLIYLLILIYLCYISLKYSYEFLKHFKENKNSLIVKHLKRVLIIVICIFINDLLIYLFANKLLSFLSFLI